MKDISSVDRQRLVAELNKPVADSEWRTLEKKNPKLARTVQLEWLSEECRELVDRVIIKHTEGVLDAVRDFSDMLKEVEKERDDLSAKLKDSERELQLLSNDYNALRDKDYDFDDAVSERIVELDAEAEAFERDIIRAATFLASEVDIADNPDGWSTQDLIDAVRENIEERESQLRKLAAKVEGYESAKLCAPADDQAPRYMLIFDDNELEDMYFAGAGAEEIARALFEDHSQNWNCHLLCTAPKL